MEKPKKLVYIGKDERIIPNYGVFKPGDEVEFNVILLSTGLFREKNKKGGEE
ncbi:hypothetical protein [Mesobacillus stamsii]|uniref:Uncharacterized protein n=1 Tax=Mesobacillus stamsii TaxID=225347 RepID=A0ABU0FY26_9BACI|nr:hypothetical protein [Mesobacillus stamsii]MDQ0414234.1 hypothetical protein [Mesobacillus stamsii]